jgi:glycosyltransferase involved in cell wall biosynthesis
MAMRVLFVSYENPLTGRSGVSVYCRDLIPALLERSVTVGVLCVQGRDWRMRPYLRTTTQDGVVLFSIVNSPLRPEDSLFRPWQDVRQPTVEALVRRCLEDFRPDALHVQTLQGYPAAAIGVARELRVPTVVTLHDFWALCPRLGLMRINGDPCDGPRGGVSCLQFCVRPRPWRQRFFQLGARLPVESLRTAFFWARARYVMSKTRSRSLWAPTGASPPKPNHRLLSEHASRTPALIRALLQADHVLAVSSFAKEVLVRHGFPEARIDTAPPALRLDGIRWQIRPAPALPIRFGFLGRAVPMKGADILARAAASLPGDRARFLLFGGAAPETRRYLRALAGDGRLEFRDSYTRGEMPAILDEIDVVVVPSVVQETVGFAALEAHAAGVPVIAARTGALPEHVRDGEKGLLFEPGNPDDLRRKMEVVVANPSLLQALSAQTRPPGSMLTHVEFLIGMYAGMIEKGGQAAWKRCSA